MAKSRWRVFRGAALALACAAAADNAAQTLSEPDCDGDECIANVIGPFTQPPCSGVSVLLVYSEQSGATLVQCSRPGAGEGNLILVFDRRVASAEALEISDGRFMRKRNLSEA